MKRLVTGFVIVFALVGCMEEERPPQFCVGSCSRTPTIEPLGKLCTLGSSSCKNGVLTCYYNCVDVESGRIQLEVEIRSKPRVDRALK